MYTTYQKWYFWSHYSVYVYWFSKFRIPILINNKANSHTVRPRLSQKIIKLNYSTGVQNVGAIIVTGPWLHKSTYFLLLCVFVYYDQKANGNELCLGKRCNMFDIAEHRLTSKNLIKTINRSKVPDWFYVPEYLKVRRSHPWIANDDNMYRSQNPQVLVICLTARDGT